MKITKLIRLRARLQPSLKLLRKRSPATRRGEQALGKLSRRLGRRVARSQATGLRDASAWQARPFDSAPATADKRGSLCRYREGQLR
jgi:hypothetical protein